MKIDVMDAAKKRYTNSVYTLANILNESAVDEIAERFQAAWDSGEGFTLHTLSGRDSDKDDELNACAQQIQIKLEQIVKRAWVSQYSRDELTALISLLTRGPQGLYTKVSIGGCLEIMVDDLVHTWNDLHQGDPAVHLPDPDFI